ncbi:alpha/beta hydrolase domain-containing protein [Yinghuangia seranimata]|uniref:alpha/beta hydrolase domain-containing protein n=1 Tax=Yinghuangia seranimata TaxID=408067 RepID=UPI00248C2AB5|nr:alpha/beta hydrolase domain-containing protein [Yinghuangia seranimata]MDI2127254.1 alpha/beta hydrolase domain-containing protein [Yinghuangia seranimata]MDI2132199.1 alpha/beta hydrolase domain-containing protein [Yinghuangia seranimata]
MSACVAVLVAAVGLGPAAHAVPSVVVPTVSGPVTGPGEPWGAVSDSGASRGYSQREYFLSGTATSYRATGPWDASGVWGAAPDATAPYTTRVLVRAPSDPARFNGTVVVEWLNVSAGFETAPDFLYNAEEMLRRGYAWVGVSAQLAGISGTGAYGTLGIPPLKGYNPARYAALDHPGDAYSYDIFTQVAGALHVTGGAGDLLPGFPAARRLIADGESQSAFRLTTYVNAIQPLAGAYDGFLIHSRFGGAAPLGAGLTDVVPVAHVRTDLTAPVLVAESETDVPYHLPARQDDSASYRLWEMPGTAHADAFAGASALGCVKPVNDGPQRYVMRAALRALDGWVAGAGAPPSMSRVATTAAGVITRDAHGNALGGIRTPQLDVPTATLTGDGNTGAGNFCFLTGTTTPLSADTLRALYPTHAAYVSAFDAAADAAVSTGAVLADDRAAMHGEADAADVPPAFGTGPVLTDITIQAAVHPGPLSMTQTDAGITLSPITINGTAQTMTGKLNPVSVADFRGSVLGWSLTGQLTDFRSDTGGLIPRRAFSWTPRCAVTDPDSPSRPQAGAQADFGGAAGMTLCAQPTATGVQVTGGAFQADADVKLAAPAYPLAGTYTATLTLSLS